VPVHGSRRQKPTYAAYICLALLFAISITSEIRSVADGLGLLLQSAEHVRDPFEIDGPQLTLTGLQPEARAAGIKDGDVIASIENRPLKGLTDFYSVVRRARPGERLTVQVQSSTPAGIVRKDASIELRPALPGGPRASDWLSFATAAVAMPFLCLALGFWVATVRIRDKQAWLLLALLLSFAQFFGVSGGYDSLYGRENLVQPVFTAYHILFANLAPATLLLFVLYFPERLDLDRRFPWAKWLVVGPLLFKVATDAVIFSLHLHHIAVARQMRSVFGFVDELFYLQFVALVLFFVILAYKTLTASGRDARRRLLLLDTAAAVSVTSIVVWMILREKFALPEWTTLLAIALWFLFPLTMAYVIVVHRAMDVRVAIRQGLRYLLAKGGVRVFQMAVSVLIIVGAATMSADRNANLPRRIGLISAGFALLAFTRIFAERLRRWVDRRFFREAYNAEQILSELANRVRTMVETGPVLEMVAQRISQSLHIPRVALLLRNSGGFQLAYGVGYSGSSVVIPEDSLTVQHLRKDQHVAVRFDDSDSWVQRTGNLERDSLEKLQPEILLPLSLNQNLLGIMSLGPKQSEEPFTRTDIRLLDSVATQTGLALENSRLTAEIATEVAQRERMNRELEIAREVQERLFPQSVPSIPGIELAGFCRPALGVGGDYYDYFALHDGQLGIAVGDVSGKGIPAALLMASLRASLRAQTMRGERDLAALMENVNTLGYDSSAVNKYATFFYGQYSPESRLLRYVNAGHEPPLIFRGTNLIRLETGGPVVGLLPGVQYEQGAIALEPGDVLVAFTDGISEAMNLADEEWGVENLICCVQGSCGIVSCELIQRVMATADAFTGGAKQHDDMTIVIGRIV
jgi:sigma-B regulation protein RsbU (phosphoserine phosphatase)